MRRGRLAGVAVGALVVTAALPAVSTAHGLAGRADLPIPTEFFAWGAAIVLMVSFAALAVLWPKPRLQEARGRPLFTVPRWVDPVCGAVGIALFGLTAYSGLVGSETATKNWAPSFVYAIFWVGLVPVSVLFGDVFRALNPWRALARSISWLAGRLRRRPAPSLPYPERLGRWPAVVGIGTFAWLELVYPQRADPQLVALLALAYAGVQLVGMALYGIEAWTRRGDAFGVYFNFYARLSPLERREGRRLFVRPPLAGITALSTGAGTLPLLFVAIGATSFDGLEATPPWISLQPRLTHALQDVGLSRTFSDEVVATVGLVLMFLAVAAFYRLGVRGMRSVGRRFATGDLARRFAHSLVPIAVAYVFAHYFSFLVFQGEATGSLASDPLGRGANLFGTANGAIDYGVLSAAAIWYVQVATLVIGHVSGLVLAHDRALVVYPDAGEATRSQGWMLVIMVGFTSFALWLLASANA